MVGASRARQEHAAAPARRPGRAHHRHGRWSNCNPRRSPERGRALGILRNRHLALRLPVPPPAAGVHGAGQRWRCCCASAARTSSARPAPPATCWRVGRRAHRSTGRRVLSGGERQRGRSLARWPARQPDLSADEPTGNPSTATPPTPSSVLMLELARSRARPSCWWTHDRRPGLCCDHDAAAGEGASKPEKESFMRGRHGHHHRSDLRASPSRRWPSAA